MSAAIRLAWRGQGHVEPNPMVGCLIVRDGVVIGEGYHAKFGGPHAEVAALQSLDSVDDARGATAYVTLEPCCHFGKTPPCADALVDAGVGRVVIAMQDPFEQVAGGGITRLRAAGIGVTVGVLGDEAAAMNAPFIKRVREGRPWVIAKWAMTIDGRIATESGESQWITGASSRAAVHQLRGRVDAIVVGMGTVIADDPMLDARPPGARVANRIVFCRRRLPGIDSKLVRTAAGVPLWLVAGPEVDAEKLRQLASLGAKVIPVATGDGVGMVDQAIGELAKNGATNVMLEGGGELLSSFFAANQVDECHVYIGAKAFGGAAAPGPIGGVGVASLDQAWRFELRELDRFDGDVRLIYRRSAD
ncbi:bifunctional diaminohydroxyphosphoribosylaminopyrimidine deaminase/5-amino-6-(5-phosphoribosylamino)uracil reductase RibD [Rubripirellula reticaptiva]|uniref:Riboflavin biosynthesis protein RibD n=1 Tax=Rubripirellula reticaptiva TaxID=2528013 RepID=A0A5C6FBW4_9BACT|nr:bifunctional diaminohydroxyphosphoribosylaminopyrimidine deaminase/5-amino-6-(5-phosphoribosylamino)uracil reductase RibD [Rubripirellula reticaptiva]TWU58067.1 Riboflavin biosynthesis protein RibD [Rubripirellula reticaptiva]